MESSNSENGFWQIIKSWRKQSGLKIFKKSKTKKLRAFKKRYNYFLKKCNFAQQGVLKSKTWFYKIVPEFNFTQEMT